MPANKYALLRYRIIDRCIANSATPFPGIEDLREACEDTLYGSSGEHISISTIEKDIWAMRNESELGYYAPIAFSREYSGYYYTEDGYTIQDISLSDEEFHAIHLAAQTLNQYREIDAFRDYNSAIDKIINRLNVKPHNPDDSRPYIQFESAPGNAGQEHLNAILRAVEEKKITRFKYLKFGHSNEKEYTVHPYLLKEYRNRWYLIGLEEKRQIVLTYGLDRITSLEVTSDSFSPDKRFNPDDFFKYSIGITQSNSKPENIVLKTSSTQGQYLASQPIHPSQKIKFQPSGCTVEIKALVTVELIQFILSLGSNVEVIKPNSLRTTISKEVEKTLQQYS